MTVVEEEGNEGGEKGSTVVVAVKVGVGGHQLLTWAMVKAAQPLDHVVALHVITNSELSSKEQGNTNCQAVNFFNSSVEVYEGFCGLKKVDLEFKITYGSSVRKVLVEEAKLYKATKVVLGASKHRALGSPISIAKFCTKKLACGTSVLVVENGKVIFERCGSQHRAVTAIAPSFGLFNPTQWRIKSKNSKVLNNSAGNCLPVVDCPSKTTFVISSNSNVSDDHFNIPNVGSDHAHFKIPPMNIINVCEYTLSEKEAFKGSVLSLNTRCSICESNIQTIVCNGKKYGHDLTDSTSLSSCESVQTVSTTSSLISDEEEESGSYAKLKPKVLKEVLLGSYIQKEGSPPGWPLLHKAISFSKAPSPRSKARQMPVVDWALRLPNRQAATTKQFQVKAENTRKFCNQEFQTQSSNESTLIEAFSKEDRFLCGQQNESNSDECFLTKKLELLCESKACKKFPYQELQSATSNFLAENFIGSGGCSRVYKGVLLDGQSVAVKVLNNSSEAEQELILEVEILTSLMHNHVVSLLGYCVEGHTRLLVYNFVSRGNLEENLNGGRDRPVLSWPERFKVAVGVAEALDYLHNGCSPSVIHRDVKSSNILLSEDCEPQLSDFGLAKWAPIKSSHINCSDVLGTFGYLAPEYFVYGKVNDKTDVYAFGVVLLELISGRKPIDTTYPKGQESLVVWAKPFLEEERMRELVDQRLQGVYDTSEMQRMMLAAAVSVTQSSRHRPHISRILKILQGQDDITICAWRQHMMTKDRDASDEDEHIINQGKNDIQTHLALAMHGVDDDILSMSSSEHSIDILQAKESFEDYLKGRCSRSSSFD